MLERLFKVIEKNLLIIYVILTILFGFLTYFTGYNYPNRSVWDEVYHISSGEKYITKTMFMEAHPPLGKLLIGLGEKIINPNTDYDKLNWAGKLCLSTVPENYKTKNSEGIESEQKTVKDTNGNERPMNLLDIREKTRVGIDKSGFTATDSIADYPEYFSFCGYRFFPVVFASLTPMIFFILILIITRNKHLSLLSSALIVFDNALLVQARAAMLDSIQIFFILTALCIAAKLMNGKKFSIIGYLSIGAAFGLVCAVKHNGIIFAILPVIVALVELIKTLKKPALIPTELPTLGLKVDLFFSYLRTNSRNILIIISKLALCFCVLAFTYLAIFSIHIGLGQNIDSKGTNNFGNYKASPEYIQIIKNKEYFNIFKLNSAINDNYKYMDEYHKGVPKLDNTKAGENGSYPTNWPVMNRTISYRWETPDGTNYRYTYLIGNPVIWGIGLISLILSSALILSVVFFKTPIKDKKSFYFILLFWSLYVIYMAFMMYTISVRVMYLYHYFIPLIFSLILAPLLIQYSFGKVLKDEPFDIYPYNKPFLIYTILVAILLFILIGFSFYSPFTYYTPLNSDQFKMRNLFDFWQMRPVK